MFARNSICLARRPVTTTVSASAPDVDRRGPRLLCAATDAPPADPRVLPCVSHLHTPDGQRKATLKVLQTSACQNNCNYCAFRAGRDVRRAAPDAR